MDFYLKSMSSRTSPGFPTSKCFPSVPARVAVKLPAARPAVLRSRGNQVSRLIIAKQEQRDVSVQSVGAATERSLTSGNSVKLKTPRVAVFSSANYVRNFMENVLEAACPGSNFFEVRHLSVPCAFNPLGLFCLSSESRRVHVLLVPRHVPTGACWPALLIRTLQWGSLARACQVALH